MHSKVAHDNYCHVLLLNASFHNNSKVAHDSSVINEILKNKSTAERSIIRPCYIDRVVLFTEKYKYN